EDNIEDTLADNVAHRIHRIRPYVEQRQSMEIEDSFRNENALVHIQSYSDGYAEPPERLQQLLKFPQPARRQRDENFLAAVLIDDFLNAAVIERRPSALALARFHRNDTLHFHGHHCRRFQTRR